MIDYNDLDITYSFDLTWRPPIVGIEDPEDVKQLADATEAAVIGGTYEGLLETTEAIKPALNEAMAQSVWAWPNVTIRKNGSDVDAPRDIVDTANLRDSMDTAMLNSNAFTITYTAPYANMVHYGGITRPYGRGGNSFVYPARPWISAMLTGTHGINQFKVLDIVEENVTKEFKKLTS